MEIPLPGKTAFILKQGSGGLLSQYKDVILSVNEFSLYR